jgi:hypothetical protein
MPTWEDVGKSDRRSQLPRPATETEERATEGLQSLLLSRSEKARSGGVVPLD